MSSENWRQNWVSNKSELAKRLSDGEAGGSYADAVILLCAALSALAAEIYPGPKIDRFRFIEMLVKFGPEANTCRTISIPLLTQHLDDSDRGCESSKLRRAFSVPHKSIVLTGPDVDRNECEIVALSPTIGLTDIRRFSYASILYKEIRSSYAHEYQPGDKADSLPMTMLKGQKVSYINRICDDRKSRRLLHFHIEWLLELPLGLADYIDSLDSVSRHQPTLWWANGG